MKKYLLSFVLSVVGLAIAHADDYTGVKVTDNNGRKTYYLFEEQPIIMYTEVEGLRYACLYTSGSTDPVVSVPLKKKATLSVKYDAFVRVNLNSAGFATFSAKDASFIATDGVTAYKAVVDGELITLTALEGNIPGGTGVLLYGDMAGMEVNLPVATSGSNADANGNSLKATTLTDGSLAVKEENSWALGDGNLFLWFTGDAFIHNRAYLVHEKPAETTMRVVFADGETVGLDNIASKTTIREGKFLENGKLVIVKNGMRYNVAGQAIK